MALRWIILFSLGVTILTGCRGILEIQIERVQPKPTASLGVVAYIIGGDVWLLDLDSGEQIRLTRDGYNRRPRLSPDENWVAYLKTDYIHVTDLHTGEETLLSESGISDYAWSPQGAQLAYVTTSGLEIWDGSTQTSRFLPVDMTALDRLSWDHSGAWIALDNREGAPREIRKVSTDGMADHLVYRAPDLMNIPRLSGWSPDGHWILIWLGSRAQSVAQDGLPLYWIPVDGEQPLSSGEVTLLWADYLSWTPDGMLAFISGDGRETWVGKGLAILEPSTMNSQLLISAGEQAPTHPAWSPVGNLIAYSAGPSTPLNVAYEQREQALQGRKIWLIEVESGRRQQLTSDNHYRDERPLWSADGSKILFVRLDEVGAQLWIMNADGSGLRQVVPELTPRPDPFGVYGYIDWGQWWDWGLGQ